MNKLYLLDQSLLNLAKQLQGLTNTFEIVETLPNCKAYLVLDARDLTLIYEGFAPFKLSELYLSLNKRNFKKELLVAAINLYPTNQHAILDLTAGLGKDAYIMTNAGFKVTMVEQNPILATMLYYAILMELFPRDKAQIFYGNSIDFLEHSSYINMKGEQSPKWNNTKADVIYLDPMFEDAKTAKSKKEIQIISNLVEDSIVPASQNEKLFNLALKFATKKVVVKRDNNARTLIPTPKPSGVKQGTTVRYDIYALHL